MSNNNLAEFTGEIIDIFEDFLESKGINIDNDEKNNEEGEAIIYGSDYGFLQTALETTLDNWNLLAEENTKEFKVTVSSDSDISTVELESLIDIGANMTNTKVKVITINPINSLYKR